MYDYGTFANGKWQSDGQSSFATWNPASPAQQAGRYRHTAPSSIDTIVSDARAAQEQWGRRPPVERARIVGEFLARIEAKAEPIAVAITREQGKPIGEARGELAKSLREARFMVSQGAQADGSVVNSQRRGVRNLVIRRPRGVIAAITPWNFPVLTPMRKIVPALVYGNAIVLKPSEFTPAAVCLIAEASANVLPDGLLQIVLGGADVGRALAESRGIDGLTFTGSVEVGRSVYQLAARNLAEVSLEMGGKNAAIINDTDDLDRCLDQVTGAAYQCAGQRCTAISRVIVQERLASDVIAGLVRRAGAFRLGDGMDPSTTMGPLIHKAHLNRVDSLVRQGIEEGARLVVGGAPAVVSGLEDGFFYQPTVLADVRPEMVVAREEVFGPVISVIAYEEFEEALRILNGTEYGLTSALFSNDNRCIQRFLDVSAHGMMHVNHGTIPDDHMPFGGIRNSGVGAYSVGRSAGNFYTTEHSAYLQYE
jgi:aldehyde dehydrogenase (NAD+)